MNKQSLLKLKYFLRGLGCGLILCVFVFSFGSKSKSVVKEMSKEDIIKKAQEYGMVDSMDDKLDKLQKESTSPKPSATPKTSAKPKTSTTPKPTQTPDPEPASTPDEDGKISEKYIEIKVSKGDTSQRVSEVLEDAGVISSAVDFNEYLRKSGYSKKIQTGQKKIKVGGSFSYIAGELISK
ncbi:hypothetical protein lbkm_1640 [Lachnospiraceae bacterium KM106-2]|nr:hypothetical protein lbkm_1640 [Lachnospiraceae bacterium KM106-2]